MNFFASDSKAGVWCTLICCCSSPFHLVIIVESICWCWLVLQGLVLESAGNIPKSPCQSPRTEPDEPFIPEILREQRHQGQTLHVPGLQRHRGMWRSNGRVVWKAKGLGTSSGIMPDLLTYQCARCTVVCIWGYEGFVLACEPPAMKQCNSQASW